MRVLLDTHTLLWWMTEDSRLSARARDLIGDSDNEVYVSAASAWEIAIKAQIGKLSMPQPPDLFIREQIDADSFTPLSISVEHALRVYRLPFHHRDPFDRVLAAQSQVERLPIVTADPAFAEYGIETIW